MDSLLFQVFIPFTLSAIVVIIVMYIAEKFGSKIGGILGTLPSTIVVAFIFIAYSEGTTFASDAAAVVPAELGINVIFLFIFAHLIRHSTYIAFLISFIVWATLSSLLIIFQMNQILTSIILYISSVSITFFYLEKKQKILSIGNVQIHYTPKKILFRGILAGIIIAIAVLLSNIGSIISGIFSVFPAILTSTMLISIREHGPDFAAGMAKSMLLGLSSVVTYATLIHFLYPLIGIIIGSIVAYFFSFIVTLSLFMIRRKIK